MQAPVNISLLNDIAVTQENKKMSQYMNLALKCIHCTNPLGYRSRFLHGLHSLNGKTYYHKISWSLEAARLGVKMNVSSWNLIGFSVAALPRCPSNFRAIKKVYIQISRLPDFTISYAKTSVRLVNISPCVKFIIVQMANIKLVRTVKPLI